MKDVAVVAYCRTGIARVTRGARSRIHAARARAARPSPRDRWRVHRRRHVDRRLPRTLL